MKKTLTLLLIAFIFSVPSLIAQSLEPLALSKLVFAKDSFPDINKHIIGEYKGHPNGSDLYAGTTVEFELLMQNENKAVVNITMLDSAGQSGIDTYMYFVKDTVWKASAFRSLAMTGIVEEMKNMLEALSPEAVDEIVKQAEKGEGKFYGFTSREEFEYELGNARLVLELDRNIIQHFKNHKNEFETLKDLALQEVAKTETDEERSVYLLENYEKDYKKLFISSASYGGYELGGNVLSFLIGGMLDNTVGYLYVKDKKDLPEMFEDRVILIREIGDGWYIYKTT